MSSDTTNKASQSARKEEIPAGFEREQKVMQMYSENAKTYMQLSGAALALTLTFARQILHIPEKENIADIWMIMMWGCFLAALVSGAFYQYLAIKYLESQLDWPHYKAWEWLEPGTVYGIMLGAFYGGAFIFMIYAIVRLKYSH